MKTNKPELERVQASSCAEEFGVIRESAEILLVFALSGEIIVIINDLSRYLQGYILLEKQAMLNDPYEHICSGVEADFL